MSLIKYVNTIAYEGSNNIRLTNLGYADQCFICYSCGVSGEAVTGRIKFVLDKPRKIRSLLIHVKGEGVVIWKGLSEKTVDNPKQQSVTYEAKEDYFKIKFYCLGTAENEGNTLAVGEYQYPFSFILPTGLPPSFEGKYGYIRYSAKAILDRPSKSNKETKTALTVLSHFDLNTYPNLKEPLKICWEKNINWWCCQNGRLNSVMMVPKSGFVSGENVPILIEINNAFFYDVSVNLKFQQFVTYNAQTPVISFKQEILVLQKFKFGTVPAKKSKTWTQTLIIPPLPSSNFGNCSVINIEYKLVLNISSDFSDNVSVSPPLIIGTVPLESRSSIIGYHQADSATVNMRTVPTAPPPDYAAAVAIGDNNVFQQPYQGSTLSENKFHKTNSIEDNDDNEHTTYNNDMKDFLPHYIVYNFNNR